MVLGGSYGWPRVIIFWRLFGSASTMRRALLLFASPWRLKGDSFDCASGPATPLSLLIVSAGRHKGDSRVAARLPVATSLDRVARAA